MNLSAAHRVCLSLAEAREPRPGQGQWDVRGKQIACSSNRTWSDLKQWPWINEITDLKFTVMTKHSTDIVNVAYLAPEGKFEGHGLRFMPQIMTASTTNSKT